MACGAIVSLVAACSSGGALFPVAGKVVFEDGAPVSFGVIEFVPRGGGAAARSAIEKDGGFALKTAGRLGAVGGDHDVYVVQPTVAEGVEPHAHRRHGPGMQPRLVHGRHGQRGQSDLLVRVDSSTGNQLVITVRDSAAKE
jgi:hypothetical protein